MNYVFVFLLCLSSFAVAAFPQEAHIPGGLIVLELDSNEQKPQVTWQGKPVMLWQNAQQKWFAWLGIPLKENTKNLTLSINEQTKTFAISPHAYPEQHLKVQNKHVNLSATQLARVQKEFAQMQPIYQSFTVASDFNGMYWPIRGRQSSGFGLTRFFNGEPRAPHSGLDIAAPLGTVINAPAAGKIVLTGDFYFNGQSVFIDHGQGLISMLCHLSRIDVKEGDQIQIGDQIGLVGATGRATGPHLHWTVSLNDARINPSLLLAESEPKEFQ